MRHEMRNSAHRGPAHKGASASEQGLVREGGHKSMYSAFQINCPELRT